MAGASRKSEIRNPKSESNLKLRGAKLKTNPGRQSQLGLGAALPMRNRFEFLHFN